MPIQAPQWSDFRLCPVCQSEFNSKVKPPISLGCGHSICKSCLVRLSKQQCPFDQAEIKIDIKKLPVNYALLSLVGAKIVDYFEVDIDEVKSHRVEFDDARKAIEYLAEFLQNVYIVGNANMGHSTGNGTLTRPMQRKLVTLIHSQLAEEEGRARAMRSARSIGERVVKELILMHQSPQTLSAALWAAVRQRGCQFLGPAMQEAVLRLILLSLEDGISLSRKVLVLFVVQKLEKQYTQASKTSIGHVVQLLYRASCFKVTKRDGDSSLLQLHEKYRTYAALRKEHDAQIVQIATEAGLHISPEQWSALLYGDDEHKSHMQSIIDKLQTPASFASSIQELIIALQRTDDPHDLQSLRVHLDKLSAIDPSPEAEPPTWKSLQECMKSLVIVVDGLQKFAKDYASKNKGNIEGAQMINTKYRTSMCRDILQRNTCPRGANCNFAHSEEELERYRKRRNMPISNRNITNNTLNSIYGNSRAGSNSSPDSCGTDNMDDEYMIEQQKNSPNIPRNLSSTMLANNGLASPSFRNGMIFPTDVNGISRDMNGMTRAFKNINFQNTMNGNVQQTIKKEDTRDLLKNGSYDAAQQVQTRTSMYNQVPFPNQQQSGFFNVQSQNQMFVSNDQAFFPNGSYLYQQQPSLPQVFPYDNLQSFPAMYPTHPSFGQHFPTMHTATARGSSGDDTSLLKTASGELSLSIPALKDSKEDTWTPCKPSFFGRSEIDSGRGSSIGNSSTDTFSPLSNASGGSSCETRKLWGNDIWAPPSSADSWSKNNWESRFESVSRLSDPDERNASCESVGKNNDMPVRSTFGESKSYSSLQDWSNTTTSDFINNNSTSNNNNLLEFLSSPTAKRQPPPPGFHMLP